MVCLSSGESELMALVGGACEGIASRDQWSKMKGVQLVRRPCCSVVRCAFLLSWVFLAWSFCLRRFYGTG